MADHRVEQIMVAVLAKVANLTTTSTNAFRGRVYPLQSTQYPAVFVYQGDDSTQNLKSQVVLDSVLEISIELVAKTASQQLDTVLNQIRKEVSIALQADITQGLSFVLNTEELGARAPALSGDGDQPVGAMQTMWHVTHRRSRTDPST